METTILFPGDNDTLRDHGREKLKPFSLYNSDTRRRRELGVIAAVGGNGELGIDGDLIWRIPDDLRHFKKVTMGHPVIMGRKTWDSLPKKPLPGRLNIVVSRNPEFEAEGGLVARSIEEAVSLCAPGDMPFIIGGAAIYAEALPYATELHLTLVEATCDRADVFFPPVSADEWEPVAVSERMVTGEGIAYRFAEYRRK